VQTEQFSFEDIRKKHTQFVCYLTGRQLDADNPQTYSFDHIVPASKGGDNTLSNLGVCCPAANFAKRDMMLPDFVALCVEVATNFGYTVIEPDRHRASIP